VQERPPVAPNVAGLLDAARRLPLVVPAENGDDPFPMGPPDPSPSLDRVVARGSVNAGRECTFSTNAGPGVGALAAPLTIGIDEQ